MESGIQSSFIPRDAGEVKVDGPRLSGAGLSDFLLLISIVLFVASAALAGGVFLYKQYLQTATNSKVEQLQRAKAAFEPSLIQQLTRLDDRMHAGAAILGAHIAPSRFFDALSQSTLATVAFRSLKLDAVDNQHMNIAMSGVAQSVNSIALQAQVFGNSGIIVNPIFGNIGREPLGVRFEMDAVVNPGAINYAKSLTEVLPEQEQQQTQAPASPFGGVSTDQ